MAEESRCDYAGPERRVGCQTADDAADRAVKKTFSILGVDVDSPKEVREFQESLRFGDKLRRIADKGLMGTVVAIGTLIGGAIVYALTRHN